jgi:glycine/D-amino acid oxidase-like deaminating enzyme
MTRVAVIGGGIFGATAAIYAARAGYEVELFEEQNSLLQAASGINQHRLHRGYHYPRSPETAHATRTADPFFRVEYAEAIIDTSYPLYAIAREGSKVSGQQFLAFCDQNALQYELVNDSKLLNLDLIELVVKGVEARFDSNILQSLALAKLSRAAVQIRTGVRAGSWIKDQFDKIIVAGYASTNTIMAELGGPLQKYQFEVCEKPVVTLPASFGIVDVVVMDGPFMNVAPYGHSGNYVLGNVVHAIHKTNVGYEPAIPDEIRPYLNRGLIKRPEHTNFDKFIESGARFIPALAEATHLGSMYTVRTVLAERDADDARPTDVVAVDEKLIRIFSGKICTCVDGAQMAVALI